MVRKIIAALAFAAALAGSAAVATSSVSVQAGGKCAPGQHGNPHPAFKPGVCDNK